jgi:hypothetical protein
VTLIRSTSTTATIVSLLSALAPLAVTATPSTTTLLLVFASRRRRAMNRDKFVPRCGGWILRILVDRFYFIFFRRSIPPDFVSGFRTIVVVVRPW